MYWFALVLATVVHGACECSEWTTGKEAFLREDANGDLTLIEVRPQGRGGPAYLYDGNYGNLGCKPHDQGLEPFCDSSFPPAWCFDSWCYVDPANCDKVHVRSKYFGDAEIYYSYGACGSTNSYSKWYEDGGAESKDSLGDLIDLIEGYVKTNRNAAEASPEGEDCSYQSSCPCRGCSPSSQYWQDQQVSFDDITVLPGNAPGKVDDGTCVAQSVAPTYLNVASKEYNDRTRIGYQYFGHHSSGAYGQWPKTDLTGGMCNGYDPRFRDWYTSAATGPKDVVLVLDKSGSMSTGDRIGLAYDAAMAILDTFGAYDFVGIVLFDDSVQQFAGSLRPANEVNKKVLREYLDNNFKDNAGGSTNFKGSIRKAFEILKVSIDESRTSTCNRAIMFLTDGEADFDDEDYAFVREESKLNSVAMLTYAIGSGADEEVTKALACENRGVFYKVPDGGDLGGLMSQYYLYFAQGSRSCTVRWVEYEDWISKEKLLAGCLPFYSGMESREKGMLRGVSCVDLNMVAPLSKVQSSPQYDQFNCMTRFVSQQCEALYLRDCDLAKMRAAAGSTCPGDTGACTRSDGYCIDPTCKDDPLYKDTQGYYCDQWVGDDCNKAASWDGYGQADQDEILRKCPYSCLQCQRLSSPQPCDEMTCDGVTGNVGCRDRIEGIDAGPDYALATALAAVLLVPVW